MKKLLPILVGLALPSASMAQTFFTQDAIVTPADATYYENGVGSPSVVYLGPSDGYVMFFETRLSDDYIAQKSLDATGCRNGALWGIGTAHSDDGLNWTVSSDPILAPKSDTFYSCVAAHPSAFYDGSSVYLYFKAEQLEDPCAAASPSWGCDRQVGVGVASFSFLKNNPRFGVLQNPSIALNVSGFGFPSVVKVGATYHMFLAKIPSLYKATGATPTSFSLNGSSSVDPGAVTWTPDRVFNPAAFCNDSSAYPFTIFLGGKDLDADGLVNEGGWGRTISPDTASWFTAVQENVAWSGTGEWRHWDAMRVKSGVDSCDVGPSNEEVLVYYSDKDANNRNQVGVAYTRNAIGSAPWNGTDGTPADKSCLALAADADGYYEDFDAYGDTAGDWDETWSYEDGEGAPANCASAPGIAGGLALLLPFALLRRRRD